MKKAVFLVVIVLHFGILNSATPKILWEREIEQKLISSPISPVILEFDGNLAAVYYGRLTDTSKINAWIIILDKSGNIRNTFFIARNFHLSVLGIIPEGENYRIALTEGLDNFKLFSVLYDSNGNLLEEKRDSNSKTYKYSRAIWHNDSVYFSDNNRPVIDVYNSEMKFIRTFYYDTTAIPFDVYYGVSNAKTFTSNYNMVTAFPCSKSKKGTQYDYTAVVKTDILGKVIWAKKFMVDGWSGTHLGTIKERNDGSFLAAGGVADSMWYYSAFLARFDKDFNLLDSFIFPYEEYTNNANYNVSLDSSRKIAFYGQYFEKSQILTKYFWLSLFNEKCELIANYKWGGFNYCIVGQVVDGENGTIIVFGRKNNNLYLACIEPEYSSVNETESVPSIRVSPNPANGCIFIENKDEYSSYECTAVDIIGKPAGRFKIAPGGRITLDVTGWGPGMYFLHARNGGNSFVSKILITK